MQKILIIQLCFEYFVKGTVIKVNSLCNFRILKIVKSFFKIAYSN